MGIDLAKFQIHITFTQSHRPEDEIPDFYDKCEPGLRMRGILTLFQEVNETDPEKFVDPNITSVEITIEGVPNMIYSQGLPKKRIFEEAQRLLEYNIKDLQMKIEDFYNNKYALWIYLLTEYFEHIFLICPTFNPSKTYCDWKFINDPNLFAIQRNHDDVNTLLKFITKISCFGDHTLIILDDCAAGQDVKDQTSKLVKLGFSARHHNISVFVSTRQLTSIAKPFRENIGKLLICFYNPNKKDMQSLFNDYLGEISKGEQNKIWEKLRNNKYARLEISLRYPFNYTVKIPSKY